MAVADVGEIGYNLRLVNTTPPMATTFQQRPRSIKSTASGPSQATEMMKSVSMADIPDQNHQASVESMVNLNAQLSRRWPPFDFVSMQFAEDNISDDFWSYPTEIPGGSLARSGDITHLSELQPTNREIFNAIQPLPTGSLNPVQTSTSDQSVPVHLDILQHITEYSSGRNQIHQFS
ncbi:hypothetical protein AnigIFM49718_000674 [Aspergillus niger]|nr:hypothetical protein AnigIFM49718_000674 [Aspergillus niger]